MSTALASSGQRTLEAVVGSEARAALLGWFFLHPGQEGLLRDLARACGLSVTPVHRQLERLVEISLLESRMVGNSKAYRLHDGFPGLQGLREFVKSTVGLVPLLQEALADLDIEVAFIFGSVAAGTDTPESDVDLFVVGDLTTLQLHGKVWPLQRTLVREINYDLHSPAEFAARMRSPSAFLMNVMRLEKIFVKGDEHVLRELAARRDHQAAPV